MLPRDPRRGSFFDLSDRTKLRLSGADRIRFVNGQITNDLHKAGDSSAIAACVLNAKGKLNAHLFVSLRGETILIDADAALKETLPARLERYIIADDVVIEDITAQFSIFHVLGGTPPSEHRETVSANRFAQPGFDLWVKNEQHEEVARELANAVPLCDRACAETFRIERGIPAWGRELTEEIIPIEANLEESCIDYEKGCYIGQEVISRMKMSGQRNKSLCGLMAADDRPLIAGGKLFQAGNGKKEVGWITSATYSERLGKHIALGYVKRPFNQPGGEMVTEAGQNQMVGVHITDLPFPLLPS